MIIRHLQGCWRYRSYTVLIHNTYRPILPKVLVCRLFQIHIFDENKSLHPLHEITQLVPVVTLRRKNAKTGRVYYNHTVKQLQGDWNTTPTAISLLDILHQLAIITFGPQFYSSLSN